MSPLQVKPDVKRSRRVNKDQSNPSIQVKSEKEVKSLDTITTLKPKELPVYLPSPKKDLPENVNGPHSADKGAARKDLPVDTKNSKVNPVQRWVEQGSWAGGNFDHDSNMAQSLTRKRSKPSPSKHESDVSGVSLREGKNPLVKSRRYEQIFCIY
ncbi:MAG: hypothetical protein Q9225_006578 [Loekoesia sp. 1 TL-2023]